MTSVLVSLFHSLRSLVRSRAALHLEILALRHQLAVVNRTRRSRVQLTTTDRVLWAWLSQTWRNWRSALHIVRPDTVVAWHRRGFRLFWTWKSRRRTGRPGVPADVRALIRELSTANPLWGAPRIHGELQKLGISVSQSTVAKFVRRQPRPPSQTWRTFLTNHASQIMAADLFVVPTVTFRLLFALVVLAHDRRRIVHMAVTDHPTAGWIAQQLRNAFPEDQAPRYLVHDRDSAFADVPTTVASMNIDAVRTAPRSPWQNAYVERIIGSIRRECLDHVIVANEAGLRARVVHDVLHVFAHASRAGEGLSGDPARPLAFGRTHRRYPGSGRPAPPLRSRRRVAAPVGDARFLLPFSHVQSTHRRHWSTRRGCPRPQHGAGD